ncbi:MAG: DNA gyrase subunit B, partial [Desulfobulbaceae bacterium]|nr:DNA gyrase subunit B [Desulfobulbaceae bacterium]
LENGDIIAQDKLLKLMQKLSGYQKLVDYLARINIGLDLNNLLLASDVHSADQFEDEAFVMALRDGVKVNNMNVTQVRNCRWKPSCYEFDAAVKDKAHMVVTVGPQIPLINEYRQCLNLYPVIKDFINSAFTLIIGEKNIPVSDWQQLIETVKSETFKGSTLQRYKGLGEMNPEQLWETTMNPEKRCLLQVTINDVIKADDMFTTLMGDKVEPRREFIQNHALEVSALDI